MCIANEVINLTKESKFFYEFDPSSDGYNPVFKSTPIVFNNVDVNDETAFILLLLLQIKKTENSYDYQPCGINIIPLTISQDSLMNGVFEIPFADLSLSPDVFHELNNISPWQFHYRFLKERKVQASPIRLVYRQCYGELVVVITLDPRICSVIRQTKYWLTKCLSLALKKTLSLESSLKNKVLKWLRWPIQNSTHET